MSDDLVATARRAKGSAVLPTVSFGTLNAESLILKMADRIEELEAKLKTVLDREAATIARHDAKLDAAEAKQLQQALAMPEIVVLVEALKLAEGLYQLGLLSAPSGLADKVVSARKSALAAVGVKP